MEDSVPGQLSARLFTEPACFRRSITDERPLSLGRESAGQSDERAYPDPGSAGRDIAIGLPVEKRRPGNIEMRPSRACCQELTQKRGCNQSASPAIPCGRAQIGDLGVELAADLARDRQLPDILTGSLGSIENEVGRRV